MINKRFLIMTTLALIPFLLSAETGIPKENRALVYDLTLAGILIVLFALTMVALTVALMSKIIYYSGIRKEKKKVRSAKVADENDESIPAIAAALHMEMRALKEEEKAILTIRKVIKPFSGWNNKALVMRNS